MLTVFVQIITIISLIIFTGLSIAAFVILSKLFIQIKYKNYLLENLVQNVSLFVRQTYKINNNRSDETIEKNINNDNCSDKVQEETSTININDDNVSDYTTSTCFNSNVNDTLVSNTFSDELNKLNNTSSYMSD